MEDQAVAAPIVEDSATLLAEVGAQFQRSGPDLQYTEESFQDAHETEKIRQEMLRDTRTLLQSKGINALHQKIQNNWT